MSENIVVPNLGESITEATVSKWLKKSGDKINADEPIVELETDKVNLEVPSPVSGILSEIKTKEGETVEVGALLGVISDIEKTDTNPTAIKKSSEEKTNVVSFEKNKALEPKIFDEKKTEEPLILTEEPLKLTEEIQKEEVLETWKKNISDLSECPNVQIKLGGLGMPITGHDWHLRKTPVGSDELAEQMKFFLDYCIEKFGTNRGMFESNFPVDKVSFSYDVLYNAFKKYSKNFSKSERSSMFHDNAIKFYKVEEA